MKKEPEFVPSVTVSGLIGSLSKNRGYLARKDVDLAIKGLINIMRNALSSGERIEIRGFGSFSLRYHSPRIGRNPKTGKAIRLPGKYVPHFKPGKELRDRVKE